MHLNSLCYLGAFGTFFFFLPCTRIFGEEPYSLNEQLVLMQSVGNQETVLKLSPEAGTKTQAAYGMYGLLFSCWMIPRFHDTSILSRDMAVHILHRASPYVDLHDPLELKPFYQGGVLTDLGQAAAALRAFKDAGTIFAHERDYDAKVEAFLAWLKSNKVLP